jgi:hypothetical protein
METLEPDDNADAHFGRPKHSDDEPFEAWLKTVRAAPALPRGILHHWAVTQDGQSSLAWKGARLMTIPGSTRIVEGLFSALRRKIPAHVAGPMKPETIANRMFVYAYPDMMREIVAELHSEHAF